ncbi:PREDICTED: cytochrome P450 93A3-like [Nicotiana attenuata]|uniref:Cytochrome p450 93a3 n=1 Tax=Nicotiana attenuata TaxID=49451 RepID=A0A1J6I6B5_NICAT|nr:PREDICTED: cytochrome P450 93A3-like [Nicotiana attenuata]OIT00557.1 cytochrome p450 93a3 [Nicotiana attenuata]
MAEIQGYLMLFLIWLSSILFLKYVIFRKKTTRQNLPPSPFGLPIIGHLHLLSPIPHQALHKLSNRYGPLIHIKLGSVPCVVVSSPEIAKQVLKTHENSFLNRPQTSVVDYLTYGSQDFSFAPYGVYWKFMKKICMSELLGGRTLDMLLPVRRDEIKCFVELLLQKAKDGVAVDIEAELLRASNNVISRMLMSERCSENEEEAGSMRKLVQEIAELTGKFNLSDYIWFFKNLDLQGFGKRTKDVHRRFDEVIERIINEHQETRRKRNSLSKDGAGELVKDLLDILLDIAEDQDSELTLTRENIKAFILDIFAAGSDTAAITTEWAIAELMNHPTIMDKAVEEIDSVVGKNRVVEESDMANLPYLEAIVKETLRLHPTGPMIIRESTQDCCIGGYLVPGNTRLLVNTWAINRDPQYWENPLEFLPERFLKDKLDVRGQHYHFLPFGSGRRGCPGTSLALQLVQTSLASMIQCFEWKVSGKLDMEEAPGITLPRANPLVCVPITRLNPFPSM